MPKKIMILICVLLLAGVATLMTLKIASGDIFPATVFQPQNGAPTSSAPKSKTVEPTIVEVTSLEGTFKLTLKKTVNQKDQTQTYTLTASNSAIPILTKTVGLAESITIPGNSWSPDNKYIYIEEINAQGEKNYFVFKASGQPVAKDQQFYDVRALFTAKKIKYTFDKVTGWASPTLLIVYTLNDKSARGPSFWFEIPSKAFMQLAH